MFEDDIFITEILLKPPLTQANVSKFVNNPTNDASNRLIPNLIGFEADKCEIVYSKDGNCEKKFLILDKDYELTIKVYNYEKKLKFVLGDKIQVWQFFSLGLSDLTSELETSLLKPIIIKLTDDQKRALIVCKPIMVR